MDKKAFLTNVRTWKSDVVGAALAKDPGLATYIDPTGKAPLHHCAATNAAKSRLKTIDSIKTARSLLEAGADVNAIRVIIDDGEEFQASPLWYAIAWGKNAKLGRFLLENGSKPHNCMWAATWDQDLETTELLFAFGAEVDPVFHDETPLLQLIKSKRLRLLGWLINKGANINFQDGKGNTPLHYAIRRNYTLAQVEELLKFGANPILKAHDGLNPVTLAAELGKTRLVALLERFS